MTQDLQQLLEKIQRDGVDKAKAEADLIVEGAQAQARSLIESARVEAARITAGARIEAEAFEHRAEETIRQSARDTLLNVEKSVTALLTNLLLKDVNTALNSTELVAGLVVEAVRAYLAGHATVEVGAAAGLADALRVKLGAEAASGVTVVTDEAAGAGFRIRIANGRVEHAFTGAAVADSLAKHLRPRLAALMKAT
jgi:V/A-type H+-transporting ATPase subunit E